MSSASKKRRLEGRPRSTTMKVSPRVRFALASSVAVGGLAFLSSAAFAEAPASCVKGVDLATLGPTSIVGQGPHGEKAASVDMLKLSDADAEKVKAGHFDADRQSRLVAIASARHHGHAEEIWRLGHGSRIRRIPGRQTDRGH